MQGHQEIIAFIQALTPFLKQKGWGRLTAYDLAHARHMVGLQDNQRVRELRDKEALLFLLISVAEDVLLAQPFHVPLGTPTKERLFEAIMTLLDALHPFQDFLRHVLPSALISSATAPLVMRLLVTMSICLEMAGIDSSGFKGAVRRKGLLAVFVSVIIVWLEDHTPDLGATMAALDQRLSLAEEMAGNLSL